MLEIKHPNTGEILQVALNDFIGDEDDERVSSWYEARQACEQLGNGWRLPTKFELKAMYTQLHLNGKGNFRDGYCYWRSSEKDNG